MKIVNSVICCASYEATLLYLKLTLESPLVDEWVLIECAYDYRGRHKGLFLQALLDENALFAPYRGRVKIISLASPLCTYLARPGEVDPAAYASAEFLLRDASTSYILDKYSDKDRVLTSDVDECFDFQDRGRRDRFWTLCQEDRAYQIERMRYIYSGDNRGWRSPMDIINPLFTVGQLRKGQVRLQDKKWVGDPIPLGDDPLVFEYCFCFPLEGVYAKYESSLHTCWSKDKIDRSLACNHWGMTDYQEISFQNRYQWFEKVKLTEKNSPAFVRENLDLLNNCLVPVDYKTNRRLVYGFTANFPENVA